MTLSAAHDAREGSSPLAHHRNRHSMWSGVLKFFGVLLSVTALAWLGRLLFFRETIQVGWAVEVLLSVAAALAGCWNCLHQYRTWTVPMRALEELLPRVQAGEAPIAQLDEIEGGPRAITPAIAELCRELRSQRTNLAELEIELRQRIASRTNALERTIGSLRQQATRDALTGLFNRRFLDQYLAQSIQRHLREHKDLCLLMIDVDHFKVLNDTLGHAAGDHLLKSIGQLIRSTIRGEDVGFRWGGDEFVILMPSGNVEAGNALATRLVSLVDALCKTMKVAKPPRLSIGMSTLVKTPAATAEAMLEEADRALYEVKNARRALLKGLNEPAEGLQSPPLSRAAG